MGDERGTFQPGRNSEGQQIGRYLIQNRLGSGGVAAVYQAYDQVDGRSVALKLLLPTADPNTISRFRHEALTAGGLKHQHIVRIYQVGTALEGDVAYIAMELVEGDSLADWLGRMGRMRPEETCNLLEPIARAMGFAHRASVIHRDIKPSNILLRPSTQGVDGSVQLESTEYPVVPLLTDFGVARSLDAPDLTSEGRTVGTPAYMAPEQCSGARTIDGRADIYSLCTVLYRSVVGRLPFSGTTTQILHAHVYSPLTIDDEILNQLPPNVVDIMRRGLSKAPEERYPDADALADALASAAGRRQPVDLTADDAKVSTAIATLTLSMMDVHASTSSPSAQSVLVPAATIEPSEAPADRTALNQVNNPTVLSAQERSLSTAQRLEQFNWIGYGLSALVVLLLVIVGMLASLNLPKMLGRLGDVSAINSVDAPTLVVATLASEVPGQQADKTGPSKPAASESGVVEKPVTSRIPRPALPVLSDPSQSPGNTTAPDAVLTSVPAVATALPTLMMALPVARATPAQATVTPPAVAPTATALPDIVSPTPIPLEDQVFTCPNVVDPAFFEYIAGIAGDAQGFRCPNGSGVHTVGSLLRFEHGFMMDLENDPAIYIYYDTNQEWERAVSTWREGDPARIGEFEPPARFLYQPENAFGELWANPQRQVSLGFATTEQPATFEAIEQTFPSGALISDEQNGFIYLFLREKLRL